ncbi:Os07g0694050 [Oryza sativa Japonica Group]|uniref:Os07g0694050 protein n=1 Tax=Oryza sativa subsp. japonica TaxID=39947 RepID=A0A0P0XB64_ORYSJ|nr:Os07g0694050 [Oryza sativa Japonica Group]
MRSLTLFNLIPLRSWSATARIPGMRSDTGSTVWPPKSSFSDMSYSCTSTRSNAISGTVSLKVKSSSHTGTQLSSIALVLFITESAGTPAIPTYPSSHHKSIFHRHLHNITSTWSSEPFSV